MPIPCYFAVIKGAMAMEPEQSESTPQAVRPPAFEAAFLTQEIYIETERTGKHEKDMGIAH